MPVGRDGHGQQEQAWGRQQQLVTGKGRGALNPPRGGWGRGRQHCSRRWWWQTHPATTAFLSHWGSEKGQGHLCRALVLAANHHGSQLVPGLLFVVLPAEQAPRLRAGHPAAPLLPRPGSCHAWWWWWPLAPSQLHFWAVVAGFVGSAAAQHIPAVFFFGEAALLMHERCPIAACKTPVEVCVPCSDPVAFCHQTCHPIKGHRGSPHGATVPQQHRPVSSRSLGTVLPVLHPPA